MIQEKRILTIEFTVIILLWALAFISPLLFMNDAEQNWRAVHVMWVECSVVGVIFLINRFLLMPRLFFAKLYAKYIISLIIIFTLLALFILYFDGINIILSLLGLETIEHQIPLAAEAMPHLGAPPRGVSPGMPPMGNGAPPVTGIIPPNISILILSVIVIALDMGLSIAVKWIISEQKQAEMKRERVAVQLSNLQNQVSPHFFMNTLNNIHALVDIDSERAKMTIIELSALMDYLLYESSNKEEVSLQREINFLNSYIELMRLRYPKRVHIDVKYDESIPAVKIPPLLFLNFIENAFKYGVNYAHDSFIRIAFSFSESHIEMDVINSNHSKSVKSSRHGLGISNSRKRLRLLYGGNFSLKISENEEIYCVNLKIPIS